MGSIVYIQINGFAILMLCALLLASFDENSVADNSVFSDLIWLVIAVLLVDLAAWALEGNTAPGVRIALYCLHTAYFTLTELISAEWLIYVYEMIYGEGAVRKNRRLTLILVIPIAAFFALLCCSPIFPSVFSLDAQNVYHRESLFFIQYVIGFGYLIAASVLALRQRAREELTEKKREFSAVASFVFYPLIGGVLQILFYGTVFLWPCTAAAIFMVSSRLHRAQVSVDALTQLNNRRRFDRYLLTCIRNTHVSRPWHLLLLDVDDFKAINDMFGHTAGDAALCNIAQGLKTVFGQSDSFIARYGGDEFAVVLYGASDMEIERMLAQLASFCANTTAVDCRPLSLSAGYARYDGERAMRPEELIALADSAMYRQKLQKKAARTRS